MNEYETKIFKLKHLLLEAESKLDNYHWRLKREIIKAVKE